MSTHSFETATDADDAISTTSTSQDDPNPSEQSSRYTPYLHQMAKKLEQEWDPQVSRYITSGNHLIDESSSSSAALGQFYHVLGSAQANGSAIIDALNGILAVRSRDPILGDFEAELLDLERVVAGYHFLLGTDGAEYWQLVLLCCSLAICSSKKEEYLPKFQRATAWLFEYAHECPHDYILPTGMAYLRDGQMTLEEFKLLTANYMTFMDRIGCFADAHFEWFELYVFYTGKEMELFEEANNCLVGALDAALAHDGFFKNIRNYNSLFLYFSFGTWSRNDRRYLLHKLLCLEDQLKKHEEATFNLGPRETACWIRLATIYAKLEAYAQAEKAVKEVKTCLQAGPVEKRLIWALEEPYLGGMRELWSTCTEDCMVFTLGYIGLVELFMPIVIKALKKWVGLESPETQDAMNRLESIRATYTEQEVSSGESEDW